MKKLLLTVASLMIICLAVGLYVYQDTSEKTKLTKDILEDYVANQEKLPDELQPNFVSDDIAYALQNEELNITYDSGENWIQVPIQQERLFAGEYNGNKQTLIPDSYVLTENRATFLVVDDLGEGATKISLISSFDQGETWDESVVSEGYPLVRFRKVDFLTDKFGYVITSGGRTMSQELSSVFLTMDNGLNWTEASDLDITTMLSDGGFIDDKTGFMSYGTITPTRPTLYTTQDAGNTWVEARIDVPEEYEEIFLIAEIPTKADNELALLVNQGSDGDYLGGKVKGEFISTDNGLTWTFKGEVQPDEEVR